MEEQYLFLHKNDLCGSLMIDEDSGALLGYKAAGGNGMAPFLGHADERLMKKWWDSRAIPSSRHSIQEILRKAGCENTKTYLAKNLALSLTDTYWICPGDLRVSWEDVSLHRMHTDEGKLSYHNVSSYDPNASLGGQLDKYWDLRKTPPVLVKTAYRAYGQQSMNEVFAAELHRRQGSDIPYVAYSLKPGTDNAVRVMCEAFTSEQIEFIPALEIIESEKQKNEQSLYDTYIEICAGHGIDRDFMQDYMDYQTMMDFIISNTDEHLLNFGVLRDTDTMQMIGPAPIFDSGNSMFFADERKKPYQRHELLQRTITGFHDKEELMLRHVKRKDLIKEDLLLSPEEAKAFYLESGLPEERVEFVCGSYAQKLLLFRDFQKGKTISFYREKQAYRKTRQNTT